MEQITVLQVSDSRNRWTSVGGRMIRIDRDPALAFGDDVFFERATDRDFRALAQAPLGRLDLQKVKEICFTYALGKREATTPAPVPKIDLTSGAVVYRVVIEANDLRAVIKPTRCADVMSRRPLKRPSPITLIGQTYLGCG